MRLSLAIAGAALAVSLCSAAQYPAVPAPVTDAEALLWIDTAGRLRPDARDALGLLGHAKEDGLDPADYGAEALERASVAVAADARPPGQIVAFDRQLTAAVVRYAHDVHVGRVDPRTLGYRLNASPDRHDFEAIVRDAIADHRVGAIGRELAPQFALYRHLRAALARYRTLAADDTLQPLPQGPAVRPGETYNDAPLLTHLLAAFGDLPTAGDDSTTRSYGGATVAAVERFQRRHGLDADGVLGRETRAALAVPLAQRVRQIELALERLRWLPHLGDERFLGVNIPMFRLWAWDGVRQDGTASFQADVIVGRAFNTQTPVFVEEMQEIVFRPYWNVPASITRHEILPALRRDPEYLRRHDMEIVSAPGAPLRVRQRPGPHNALGLVKFVFPNDQNVYVHGTPAPALFARARRDFSHGCIRVEDPVGLAEWVLSGQPPWTRELIVDAMNGDHSVRVPLTRPVRVVLFYLTAVVTPEDSAVHFAADIYGHDARLDRELRPGT